MIIKKQIKLTTELYLIQSKLLLLGGSNGEN